MEAFRTLIRGWLGKVLLVLFLAPLALVGIEGYFSGSNEPVAVKVNGEKITQKELDTWIKSQKDQYLQAVNGDETLLNNKVIEDQVYDAAIVRTLLLQQAEKLGITLSDEQLGTLLRQQQVFQQDGKFSQTLLDNYLMGTKSTINQLLADFRKQTSLSLLTNSILNAGLYSDKDTQKLINLLSQERTTHLAEISLDQFAQNFVASDAQIKAYFDKHSKDYIRQANVDVNYVILSKAQFADQVQVTDQDIQQQYQSYVAGLSKDATRQISHILITTDKRTSEQALKIAQDIETKLKAGESFNALVQQYSEDPVSKQEQGKVDGYTVGAFGDAFDNAVLALKQGQTSAPVKTDFGYHVIRLDKIEVQQVPALAQVRDQLISDVKKSKLENVFQDAVNNANDLAVQSDSLEALADQYKVQVQSEKNVTQATNSPVLSQAAVKTKLFSTEIAQGDQNVSTGINLKDDAVLWFKVSAYRAERPETLVEAKGKIQAKLKREEQIKQANASVKQLLADFKTKTPAQALAASSVKFQDMGPVPRYSQIVPIEIEKAIYSVPAPQKDRWSATTVGVGNYLFVVAVSDIGQNPAFQLNDQQKAQVVNRFDARGQQELNDYIEYLKSTAKIKKTEK
ncbi:MAG: SurA N-terminal domain-containing protein [Acinetobacter populi]|jgi:peptidyl-prolyl cis-trans isomerase D|uniref:SurA N-terminal domain-containing protein n=1 Tax=Acinetobacter populi TaxID=1582270 RepID=UPI0023542D97|nr:SurA N-terminal domain-containing protein [Acinetobacter populi]MCH4247437.1 SurA N-terminal domain-containing protein [Acinetobacter populi]